MNLTRAVSEKAEIPRAGREVHVRIEERELMWGLSFFERFDEGLFITQKRSL